MTPEEDAVVHLRELIEANDKRYEQRFLDSQSAVSAALAAAEKAVTKAEAASDKRFEGVNEFRAALGDQQRTLMPRAEAEQRLKTIEQKLDAVGAVQAGLAAERGGMGKGYAAAIASVSLILGLIAGAIAAVSFFNRTARP